VERGVQVPACCREDDPPSPGTRSGCWVGENRSRISSSSPSPGMAHVCVMSFARRRRWAVERQPRIRGRRIAGARRVVRRIRGITPASPADNSFWIASPPRPVPESAGPVPLVNHHRTRTGRRADGLEHFFFGSASRMGVSPQRAGARKPVGLASGPGSNMRPLPEHSTGRASSRIRTAL